MLWLFGTRMFLQSSLRVSLPTSISVVIIFSFVKWLPTFPLAQQFSCCLVVTGINIIRRLQVFAHWWHNQDVWAGKDCEGSPCELCVIELTIPAFLLTYTCILQDFQEGPGAQIFLLTTQVGGLGLTLTKAARVIVVDPAWNPRYLNNNTWAHHYSWMNV
jgi:hypothetical protein